MADTPLSPMLAAHIAAASTAMGLGAVQFTRAKIGDRWHRVIGYVWVGAMLATSATSFWIFELLDGLPSPIHLLSVFVIYSVIRAVHAAKRGDVERHRQVLRWTYISLLIAFAFTLLPTRLLGGLFLDLMT